MTKLVGAEIFRLRHRALPYAFLAVLFVYMFYVSMHNVYSYHRYQQYLQGISVSGFWINPEATFNAYFILPGAIYNYLSVPLIQANVFLAIAFGALVIGNEYSWGTLRQTLVKGAGRIKIISAKYMSLGLALLLGILAIALAGFLISLVTTYFYSGNINWGFFSTGFLINIGDSFFRMFLILATYTSLGAFMAVLFRSPVAGVAIAAGLIELDTMIFDRASSGFIAEAGKKMIYFNSQQLAVLNADWMHVWQPALILGLYMAFFILASFLILRRQELTV